MKYNKIILLGSIFFLIGCDSKTQDSPSGANDNQKKSKILHPINHLEQQHLTGPIKEIKTYHENKYDSSISMVSEVLWNSDGWMKSEKYYLEEDENALVKLVRYQYYLDDSIQSTYKEFEGYDTIVDLSDHAIKTYYFNNDGKEDSVFVNKKSGFGRDFSMKKIYDEKGKEKRKTITYFRSENKLIKDTPESKEEFIYSYTNDSIRTTTYTSEEFSDIITIVKVFDSKHNLLEINDSRYEGGKMYYKYFTYDKYGNWTKRNLLSKAGYFYTEVRVIKYF